MKMLITLEVEFTELPESDREEYANDMNIPVDELPKLVDYEPYQLADLFNIYDNPDVRDIMFGGSDVYATFKNPHVRDFEVTDE